MLVLYCCLQISTEDKIYSESCHYMHKAWEFVRNEYDIIMSPPSLPAHIIPTSSRAFSGALRPHEMARGASGLSRSVYAGNCTGREQELLGSQRQRQRRTVKTICKRKASKKAQNITYKRTTATDKSIKTRISTVHFRVPRDYILDPLSS